MTCGCGTRAGRFAKWLGFRHESHTANGEDVWHLDGARGYGRLVLSATRHHTRLTIAALAIRFACGRATPSIPAQHAETD